MKAFVISLRGSARLPRTLSGLAAFGIIPEVMLGVRGSIVPQGLRQEMVFRQPMRDILLRRVAPGELGCSLSHYLVLNQIVKRGIERAMILEDDVHFTSDPTPTIARLGAWSESRHNFVLNWGGQRDPRFSLPISTEVHRSEAPRFSILQFPEMLWGSYCLFVDRAYCIERLRKAFPVLYIYDVYGMLGLESSFFVLKEDSPTCDPDLPGESTPSTIEPRKPSLISRVFTRDTMSRLRLERLRDRVLRTLVDGKFWSLERTQAYLDRLQVLCETDFSEQVPHPSGEATTVSISAQHARPAPVATRSSLDADIRHTGE